MSNLLTSAWQYFTTTPPVELYKFQLGGSYWRYVATYDKVYTYLSEIYNPDYITRSSIHYSNDSAKDVLTVTLAADNEIAQTFFAGTPEYEMSLKIFRGDFGAGTLSTIWSGFVNGSNHTFNDNTYTCELTCETIASRMDRRGLPRNYQVICPHRLFDQNCQLNKQSWARYIMISSENSAQNFFTTYESVAENYFTGGQVIKANGQRRFIMYNNANTFVLERGMDTAKGEVVTLYPGCNKSWSDCTSKFNNGLNYGGNRWIPTTNPFYTNIG